LEDTSALPPQLQRTLAWHQRDNDWSTEIFEWVKSTYPDWISRGADLLSEDALPEAEDISNLVSAYVLWHMSPDDSGATVAQRYFRQFPKQSQDWQSWHEAQHRSWLGVWEMREVNPGRGAHLTELLTREERYVYERQGSQQWQSYLGCLARVVDLDQGLSVVAGFFPIMLPSRAAETVRQKFLDDSFPRRRKLKPADLRAGETCYRLTNYWNGATLAWYRRPQPTLVNHDGDPVEWCTDCFAFAPEARPDLLERLGALGPVLDDGAEASITLSRAPRAQNALLDTVTVGTIRVQQSQGQAQANSVKRADDLRARLVACAGDLLRFLRREQKGMDQLMKEPRPGETGPETALPQELQGALDEHLRQLRQQHMNRWVDLPVPALGGKTPRQAILHPEGRKELQLLLKEFAQREARTPTSQRISLEYLHKELGFSDGL
jgi:hypothetical protein